MSYSLRAARPDDVAEIAEWTQNTFEWGDYLEERLPGWLSQPDSYVVVCADDQDRPIGVAHTLLQSADEAWMEAARVHPDHRRHGIGSAMNQAGTSWARGRGARIARLAVETANQAAQNQVESIGYRKVSTWTSTLLPARPIGLPEAQHLRPSPATEVESAWTTWSLGDLAIPAKSLLSEGWRWRMARLDDLVGAAGNGELLQSQSGWMLITQPEPDLLRCGWLATDRDSAPNLIDAAVQYAQNRGVSAIRVFAPSVPWLDEAMVRSGGEGRATLIYALTL